MNRETIPVIRCTTDYSLFKTMPGNRDVGESRVKTVTSSIEEIGLIPAPIVVNEHMEVIDGQARLEACRRLGLPVYYIIVPGIGLHECVTMNISAKAWTLEDYIRSYASIGNENYVRLAGLIDAHNLPLTVSVCAATGLMTTNNETVKNGKLDFDAGRYSEAEKMLGYVERFVPLLKEHGVTNQTTVFMSLCFCYQCDKVDNARLLEAFRRHGRELANASKVIDALEKITDIYNYHRNRSEKVYIATEYHMYNDKKYPWYANKWGPQSVVSGSTK